jgi:hypothetical protein
MPMLHFSIHNRVDGEIGRRNSCLMIYIATISQPAHTNAIPMPIWNLLCSPIEVQAFCHRGCLHDIIAYCFFCAFGPISLLNAKYDTSKLVKARMPTSRMRNSGMMAAKPMKSPGVKY